MLRVFAVEFPLKGWNTRLRVYILHWYASSPKIHSSHGMSSRPKNVLPSEGGKKNAGLANLHRWRISRGGGIKIKSEGHGTTRFFRLASVNVGTEMRPTSVLTWCSWVWCRESVREARFQILSDSKRFSVFEVAKIHWIFASFLHPLMCF